MTRGSLGLLSVETDRASSYLTRVLGGEQILIQLVCGLQGYAKHGFVFLEPGANRLSMGCRVKRQLPWFSQGIAGTREGPHLLFLGTGTSL